MEELAKITAFSSDGFSSPKYKETTPIPTALEQQGVTKSQWESFLSQANQAVQFNWGIDTICCFLCNRHNKLVSIHMQDFCEQINNNNDNKNPASSILPKHIHVSYEFKTEKRMVQQTEGGAGATLESFHILTFSKKEN